MQFGPQIVLGAGTAIVDLSLQVNEAFLTREMPEGRGGTTWVEPARLDELLSHAAAAGFFPHKVPGGSTGNLLCGLSGLGVETRFLGWLGRDADGRFYSDTFAEVGGDIDSFHYHPTLATGRCLCMITPDAERTMATSLAASAEMTPDGILDSDLDGVTLLHTEGYLCGLRTGFLDALLNRAKEADIPVSFDLASYAIVRSYHDEIRAILHDHVEIVFANELEAAAFAGTDDPELALNVLSDLCPIAAVKLGPLGSIVRMNGQTCRIPPEPATPVDATGAGDLWQAGFLYGVLNHASPEVCGRIGSIFGAAAVSTMGARLPEALSTELRRTIQEITNQR